MDETHIEILARAAGLERALTGFREDVIAAASEALARRGTLIGPLEPADEPWPPMRPGIGL